MSLRRSDFKRSSIEDFVADSKKLNQEADEFFKDQQLDGNWHAQVIFNLVYNRFEAHQTDVRQKSGNDETPSGGYVPRFFFASVTRQSSTGLVMQYKTMENAVAYLTTALQFQFEGVSHLPTMEA